MVGRLDGEVVEPGVLVRDGPSRAALKRVVRRPGALKRFLEERDG